MICETRMPETKTFTCVALAAIAPGTARPIRALISGVSRGRRMSTRAPERLTPHHSSAAWETPAASTPHDAAWAAPTGLEAGSTATRVQRFRRMGAAADRMNRLRAFSTPERWA